jgi:hypothetical protein
MLAVQGLQLHYIIVVAKLALHKNCHFLADQRSATTVFIVVANLALPVAAKFTLLKIVFALPLARPMLADQESATTVFIT